MSVRPSRPVRISIAPSKLPYLGIAYIVFFETSSRRSFLADDGARYVPEVRDSLRPFIRRTANVMVEIPHVKRIFPQCDQPGGIHLKLDLRHTQVSNSNPWDDARLRKRCDGKDGTEGAEVNSRGVTRGFASVTTGNMQNCLHL